MRVTTEKIVFGGKALARLDGKTVFIPFALPDEKLDITVTADAITAKPLLKKSLPLLHTELNRPARISGNAADVICKWLMTHISKHSVKQW